MEADGLPEEHAFRRVARVSGPSSWTISRLVMLMIWIWLGETAVLLVIMFSPVHSTDVGRSTIIVGLLIFGALGVSMFVTMGLAFAQLRRELKKGGYTPQPLQNAVQIDSPTGVVIREAGDPLLSGDALKSRLAEARAWAKEHPAK